MRLPPTSKIRRESLHRPSAREHRTCKLKGDARKLHRAALARLTGKRSAFSTSAGAGLAKVNGVRSQPANTNQRSVSRRNGGAAPAEAVIQADGQHVYVLADAVIEHARKTGIVKELFESPIQQIVRMHEEQLAATGLKRSD